MPREKGKFGVPSLGTALNPMPCGPRALGNVAAMQEEARRAEVCLLAWVLGRPSSSPTGTLGVHTSTLKSLGAGVRMPALES